uniref:F-box family protein n=1 Tax=Pithovirus LCPAC401 TaxID=2506595 RepID=A0A481Z9M8_9VIRU|nr:MAG: F-box family protein [Pithovirus LCPAC401]
MASVSEILARFNLSRRDLNNVSLSQLRTIFQDLTIKEISKLCTVNKRFNTLCKDESFWRNKASDDYGIHKKYGNTWRQTARNMDKVNMINMNGVWIDGRTYKEILDDALQNGSSIIPELQKQYLLLYVDNYDDHFLQELQFDATNDDIRLNFISNAVLGRDYTDDELNDIYYIKNREINVLYAAVFTYNGMGLYLPGKPIFSTVGTALPSYEFIREMIDPILYVMQFSSFSDDRLATVTY